MYGEVAERLKAHAWKVCIGNPYPGFESLPLRFLIGEIGLANSFRNSRTVS